jgi:hypothetical protein
VRLDYLLQPDIDHMMRIDIGENRAIYAGNNIAKSHVNWGIRIRRECLSGYFRESPEAHVSLFLDMNPVPSQRRKPKS